MRFLSTLAASVLGTLLALGLVVFVVFFFFFALAFSADTTPTVQPASVLTVPIEGPIPERATDDPFQRAFGEGPTYDLHDLQTAVQKARSDDRIEAVWLQMKGTSAQWGTLEEVRAAVQELRAHDVPVIASAGEFGLSEKDYYVASAADSVFVGPQSWFEYNGFSTTLTFFKNAFDELQLEPEVVRAGQYKSAVEPFTRTDLSEPNRRQLSALLTTVNEEFTSALADARPLSASDFQTLAEEDALLTAERAAEEGLVDGLRYEDEVRSLLQDRLDRPDELSTIALSDYQQVPASSAGVSYTGTGSVAIVYAEGNIVAGDPEENPFAPNQQALGSRSLIESLRQARTSSTTNAVVLRINSPGGSAAASEAMWREVKRTAEEKPLIVSMGDVAASGGYYIAAPADTIMADATTTTGSIGVFGLLWNAEGLFENQLGVTIDAVSTSPYADMFSPLQPLEDAERRLLASSIDETYRTFLERVAEGRDMDTSAVHEIAQGRVWSGRDAKEVGLVDETGSLQDAIQRAGAAANMGEGPYDTRILPRPKTVFERLNEQFAAQAQQLWHSVVSTSLERELWRHKRVLDRVTDTDAPVQTRLPFRPTIE